MPQTLKLSIAHTYFVEASKKVSDNIRQLALAGIGIVWAFKTAVGSSVSLDPKLIRASLCIVFALLFDFLQYVVTAYIWSHIYHKKEASNPDLDQQFLVGRPVNWPNKAFFFLKIVALVVAYSLYIIPFLWWRVNH